MQLARAKPGFDAEPCAQLVGMLLDEAGWWMAKAADERVPDDRLWFAIRCASCGELASKVARLNRAHGALVRTEAELDDFLRDAITVRPAVVPEPTWAELHACSCGAPSHHCRIVAAALFRSMLGTGAGLAAACLPDTSTLRRWRIPLDGVAHELDVSRQISEAFGTPLTLLDAWLPLAERLPPPPGEVVGVDAEDGVWMFVGTSGQALRWAIDRKLRDRPRVAVGLDPGSLGWPAPLEPIVRAARDGCAAVVVERAAIGAHLRAFARRQLGMDVVDEGATGCELRGPQLAWPLRPEEVALRIARDGLTLARAAAQVLADAASAAEARLGTLRRLVEHAPGGAFEVQGSRVTARRPDGTDARTLDLASLPPDPIVSDRELARHAAFLFDLAPPWADPTRVCPCGAAATVERRLVPWPWTGARDQAPRALEILEMPEGRAAVVAAICCDRHVRLPSEAELERLGLAAPELDRRIREDAARRAQRIDARLHGSGAERSILAEAPMVSAMVLDDGRLAALHSAMGAPFDASHEIVAWAVGPDTLVLGPPRASRAALAALGPLVGSVPFSIRRTVNVNAAPSGTVTLASAGRD